MKVVRDKITGNLTFLSEEGMAICPKESEGPSLVITANAPAMTHEDAWKDCEYGEKGEPMKYSARSILRELRELGKYEAFRQLLTQIGYDWEFLSANYLAEDDADFKRLKTAVVEAGVVSSMTELDAMLEKCVWSEE